MSIEMSHIHSFWWVNVTYQPILVDQCINFVYIIIIYYYFVYDDDYYYYYYHSILSFGRPCCFKIRFCGIYVDAFALLYLPELFWENILRKFQETHDQMVKTCRNHVAQQLVAGQWMSVLPLQPPQRPSPHGVGVYRILWKTASTAMHQFLDDGDLVGWNVQLLDSETTHMFIDVHWRSLMFIDVHWWMNYSNIYSEF